MMEPGFYLAVLSLDGGELGQSTSGKPRMELHFLVTARAEDGGWAKIDEEERSVFIYLSDAAYDYAKIKLDFLGFNWNYSEPDFRDDLRSSGVILECKHYEYQGSTREQWDLPANQPGVVEGFTPKAIPTQLDGLQMRSRLEAKWGRMLSLLVWPWSYEPFDLNGYIPDFICPFEDGDLLVEVKPAMSLSALGHFTAKIEDSGWDGEALIVGGQILEDCEEPVLGLLGSRFPAPAGERSSWSWDAGILFTCRECNRASIHSLCNSYHCRRCGVNDNHMAPFLNDNFPVSRAKSLWAMACNLTQWKPRQEV